MMSKGRELLRLDAKNEYLLYTHTPISPGRFIGNYRNVLIPKSFLGKNAWFITAFFLHRNDLPDVLLFNMPLLPLVLPRAVRTIPIFYELSAYQKPGARSLRDRLRTLVSRRFERAAVERARQVVTASKGGKEDIVGHFGLPAHRVSILPLGFQKFTKDEGGASRFEHQHGHFLFVGRVKHKKNVHHIVDGFIAFRKRNPHATNKLFVVGLGGGTYNEHIAQRVRDEGLRDEVVFTGFVSNGDMYHLYKNARALVFCSLQEGFGMPILEAMDFGIPVITSNRAPMDEVGGEAAVIVDPERVEEISHAMELLAFDEAKWNEHVRRGLAHAKLFSWEKHARELLALLYDVSKK